MQINLLYSKRQSIPYSTERVSPVPLSCKLATLKCDTISFGAMKKSQFNGVDFAVVESFKAPIEKFHTNNDLQNWAKTKIDKIKNTDFEGRHNKTKIKREVMLKEWIDYVTAEHNGYNSTAALLILTAVIKDFKSNNDKLPPILNKTVLAECMSEIDKSIKEDRKYQFDLNKMYETKLRVRYLDNTNTSEFDTKWVVIPSKQNNPEDFEQNVKKLTALSHKSWCTNMDKAAPYLTTGDMHIYLENGKPKIGIRFIDDEIREIQSEFNNGKIPVQYLEQVEKYILENNYKLLPFLKNKLKTVKRVIATEETDKARKDLKEAIAENDAKKIFNYFGINVQEDKDGLLTITEYKQPSDDYTFECIGIDENRLFKKVKAITGNANFRMSKVTDLGNLEYIGGDAFFWNSLIKDLANLETIGGSAFFENSPVKDLANLKIIGGNADFIRSQVADLGELKTIGGNVFFYESQVTSLGNLEHIGGDANFKNSKVSDLGKLKSVGGDVCLFDCNLKAEDFRNVEIKGDKGIIC